MEESKRTTIEADRKITKKLRLLAIEREVPLRVLVNKALIEFLEKNNIKINEDRKSQ